jgi:hypothetical protein
MPISRIPAWIVRMQFLPASISPYIMFSQCEYSNPSPTADFNLYPVLPSAQLGFMQNFMPSGRRTDKLVKSRSSAGALVLTLSLKPSIRIPENMLLDTLKRADFMYPRVFKLCTHGKPGRFATKRSVFTRGKAVMAYKTSFLASRLQLWRLSVTHFYTILMYYF